MKVFFTLDSNYACPDPQDEGPLALTTIVLQSDNAWERPWPAAAIEEEVPLDCKCMTRTQFARAWHVVRARELDG